VQIGVAKTIGTIGTIPNGAISVNYVARCHQTGTTVNAAGAAATFMPSY